jgi:putative oxidoreductase
LPVILQPKETVMPIPSTTALGARLLRVSLGVMYLGHSVVLKLLTFGLAGTAGFFTSVGLPAWLAYLTFAAEAVGGVLLVLGVQARWTALALTPALVGAIAFVHAGNGWVFTAPRLARQPRRPPERPRRRRQRLPRPPARLPRPPRRLAPPPPRHRP